MDNLKDFSIPDFGSPKLRTGGPTAALTEKECESAVSAMASILLTSAQPDENDSVSFPASSRPLFRAYLKLCFMADIPCDHLILSLAFQTWGIETA